MSTTGLTRGRLVLASACIAIALAGCGGSKASTNAGAENGRRAAASFYTGGTPGGTPVRGGTAVIDRPEAPASLDPLEGSLPGETVMALAVFDQLVETFPGSDKEPQPALARSWTVSPDGLTVTFQIRRGVEFSNGEPLTGEDVVYSLDRLSQPVAVTHYLSALWTKVSLAGPMTVVVHLKKPTPALLDDLSISTNSIVPKKLIEREGQKQFAVHPVGTGPFMVTSTTPANTTVKMVRNPRYWRHGGPYLDGLVWNQVADANARMLAVRSGAATIATNIPFSQADSLTRTPGVRLLVQPFSGSLWELVNNAAHPFNEINVRRALAYATPREAIIRSVYAGLGEPSNNVFGNQVKYWDPSVPAFPYDIAKAKELLRHSSVPNGFDMTILVPSSEPELALIASIEQSSWAKIGVHAKVEPLEVSSAISRWLTTKYQVFIPSTETSIVESPGPDQPALECEDFVDGGIHACFSNYDSPQATALVRKAVTSQDEATRKKLFGELQYLVNFKEAGHLSIAFVPRLTLVNRSLRGFSVPPTGYFRTEQAWLQR